MATYTAKFNRQCPSGGCTYWDIYRDGTKVKTLKILRHNILATPDWTDVDEFVPVLFRDAALSAGATTAAQAKTAIEAKEWVL